jgi:orotate phosphoribosyltransferase
MSSMRRRPLSGFETNLLRSKVFDLIKAKSFSKGKYVLASGKESNYYLDLKPAMLDPEGTNALSELILEKLEPMKIDYVGGLALGAVPLISVISMLSHQREHPIPGFFVRKEVKDHGTKKLVEGLSGNDTLKDKRVVILDDVTTTGGSAMVAVRAAQEAGAKVILVLSIVDREEGAAEFYKKENIPFEWLFTANEFLNSD